MANATHLAHLLEGVPQWNAWRKAHPKIQPDLTGADLTSERLVSSGPALVKMATGGPPEAPTETFHVDLRGINLSDTILTDVVLAGADLSRADLAEARLGGANLVGALIDGSDLREAYLYHATLYGATITGSSLVRACLHAADLFQTNLSGSDLTGADLTEARMLGTDLRKATLVDCHIWGAAIWNVNLAGAKQGNLLIDSIRVDDLASAQFLYALMTSDVRNTFDVITRRVVLILGRFTDQRKQVLDMVREELRRLSYVPIIFDFETPSTRNMTETISMIAHLSRFIVADITDAKSVPQELQAIIPDLPSVPVVPILLEGCEPYAMFGDYLSRPQVLQVVSYKDAPNLRACLAERVVVPAETRALKLADTRLLTETTLQAILDSSLPAVNRNTGFEDYKGLLAKLRSGGIVTGSALKTLIMQRLPAALAVDAKSVKQLLELDPEAWEDQGATGDRLALGVHMTHVGLVSTMLSLASDAAERERPGLEPK